MARAPIKVHRPAAADGNHVAQQAFYRRKAGAGGEHDHRLLALLQGECAQRAANAQNGFFFHAGRFAKQHIGKQTALVFADMQFQNIGIGRMIGHRIAAHMVVAQQNINVLAGPKHKRRRFGQSQLEQRHIMEKFDAGHARGQRFYRWRTGTVVTRHFQRHIALRRAATHQYFALGHLFAAQRQFGMAALLHLAGEHFGLALAANAVLAGMGQIEVLAFGRGQNRLAGFNGESGVVGGEGNGIRHNSEQAGGKEPIIANFRVFCWLRSSPNGFSTLE